MIVPLGTKLKSGKVEGVQSSGGERYYFLISETGCVAYMPADVIEREYTQTAKEKGNEK
jgi:hypothetical protein